VLGITPQRASKAAFKIAFDHPGGQVGASGPNNQHWHRAHQIERPCLLGKAEN
jgi:hypothetical protein